MSKKIVLLKHKDQNIYPATYSLAIIHKGELLYEVLDDIKIGSDLGLTSLQPNSLKTINNESLVGSGNIEIHERDLIPGNAISIEDSANSNEKLISVTSHTYDEENNNCKFGRDNNIEGINSVSFGSNNEILSDPESPIEFIGYCKAPDDEPDDYFPIDDRNYTLIPHNTDINDRLFRYKLLSDILEDSGSHVLDIPDLVGSILYADSDGAVPLGIVSKSMYAYGVRYGEDSALIYFSLDKYPSDISSNFMSVWRLIPAKVSENSIIHGSSNLVHGSNAHAEGINTEALEDQAHSEGELTTASGTSSHAEGWGTTASGYASHAEGKSAIASGEGSHAEGWEVTASGDGSHAEGLNTTASGMISHAEGDSATAFGEASHAEGSYTTASGLSSHAEGYESDATNSYAHAEGYYTTASGLTSHAEGNTTTALGEASHAEGTGGNVTLFLVIWYSVDGNTRLYYNNPNSAGGSASDSSYNFLAGSDFQSDAYLHDSASDATEKYRIERTNKFAGWIGRTLYLANGSILGVITRFPDSSQDEDGRWFIIDRAAQIPLNTWVSAYIKTGAAGESSHSEGHLSDAAGKYSHAEGERTRVTGTAAHGEGIKSQAFGAYSHAEGELTQALAFSSHSEGKYTHAEGEYTHVEGYDTKASGLYAHAEGIHSSAQGEGSHAEGYNCTTDGNTTYKETKHKVTLESISDQTIVLRYVDGNLSNFEDYFDTLRTILLKNPNNKPEKIYLINCVVDHTSNEYIYLKLNSDIRQDASVIDYDRGYTIGATYNVYKEVTTVAAHAEGKDTVAAQTASHSEGINTRADGDASHAEGIDSKSSQTASHSEGINTRADGDAAHSEGIDSKVLSKYAHAEGVNTFINEHSEGSHTEGYESQTDSNYSHAEGWKTFVQSKEEFVNRNAKVKILSYNSTTHHIVLKLTEGNFTSLYRTFDERKQSSVWLKPIADEGERIKLHNFIVYSTDYDNFTVELAPRYDVWGTGEKEGQSGIKGDVSYNISDYPNAIFQVSRNEYFGYGAHAEGGETYTEGTYSHAEGEHTKALNHGAHSEGFKTEAKEKYSHAEGWYTEATHKAEHAQGRCNKSNDVHINTSVEYVDLDLPSGNLWATCNIGASNPEDYGNYYAWGETETKETYDWSTYKWCNGTYDTLTKYCTGPDYWDGNTPNPDGLTRLVLEDDIAAKTLSENWRIPSKKDFEELIENTDGEWTSINGINGWKFISKSNSNLYIFLPAAGFMTPTIFDAGISGHYVLSSISKYDSLSMEQVFITSDRVSISDNSRDIGFSIRPVSSKLKTINSVGVGESDGDHRNALEITTDGSIFIKGVGDYDGSNPQSGKSLQLLLLNISGGEAGLAPETAIVIAAALNDLNDRINAIPQSQT